MKVLIASKNNSKMEGISNGFREFFPRESIEVDTLKTKSNLVGTSTNDDVFRAVQNRLQNAKRSCNNKTYDAIVSCEIGLVNQFGCWFIVYVVVVEKDMYQSIGISTGVCVPEEYALQMIRVGLKDTFNSLFDGKGGISLLSNGLYSRKTLIKTATVMALANINWPES